VIDEANLAGTTQNEYVFFGGKRVARRDVPTGHKHYYFSDHLGSASVITSDLGVIQEESDYFPYGGEIAITNGDPNNYKFTGKERDSESGLDNFGARYDASSLGRFMSPDPVHILKQKLVDPQQWNMYAYVRNNPLRFVDPTGKWVELVGNDEERKKALEALQKATGDKNGKYLYDNEDKKTGKHYVGIYTNGQDGKSAAFEKTNAAANKLGGIIQDTHRGAMVAFDTPGPHSMTGSLNQGMSPARTPDGADWAVIHVTSGEIGSQRGELQSNRQPFSPTLADVLSHEFGHVDADWYHGGQGVGGDPVGNGDAVRMENETRQLNAEPLRTGHDVPGDVQLSGAPF
jgi:RHS repeat-associated protein